jgi:hypothetical protein
LYQPHIIKGRYNPNDPPEMKFQDEPAYLFKDTSPYIGSSESGPYMLDLSQLYFIRGDRLYNIQFYILPSDLSVEWKSHPYYKYLEQSAPITNAIIQSFRFVD